MRVLMLSKALIVGQYQSKPQMLASNHPVQLTVVVPPSWRDERGEVRLERKYIEGYELVVAPLRWNGRYHLHYYPSIGSIIDRVRPDIVHLDEEPYNLATFHALRAARRHAPRASVLFFTWQNLPRRYPVPFRWLERYVYRHAAFALAGNQAAVGVLRGKGYAGPARVIPQFGVNPDYYHPSRAISGQNHVPRIGYAGRLVPEKGVDLLLRSLASLSRDWNLVVLGSGPERERLGTLASALGIAAKIEWMPWQPSEAMAGFYRSLDILAVPSISRPNWTEQFGRVLVEAMCSGVALVGSSAGEIPNVIGDAGRVFAEGDSQALTRELDELLGNPSLRNELGERGRKRVLDRFTQQRIAAETYDVYCQMMSFTNAG